MSIFGNLFKAGSRQAADSALALGARKFPELMSEAQVMEYDDHVTALAGIVANSQFAVEKDRNELEQISTDRKHMTAVAKTLIKRATDAGLDERSASTDEEKSLIADRDLAYNNSMKLKTKEAEAQARLADSEAVLEQAKTDHQEAAEYAVKSRQILEDKRREMSKAQADTRRQAERERDAKIRAGVTRDPSSLHRITDAMDANIQSERKKAAASAATADAYKKADSSTHGGTAFREALAAVDGNSAKPKDGKSMLSDLD